MKLNDLLVLHVNENKVDKNDIDKVIFKTVNKVIYASNAFEARNLYKTYSPCLIIVDSDFKNMEAINFLKEIRKDDIKTAFIVITNNKDNKYLHELMELYLTKYIVKPCSSELISIALNKCMEIIEKRIYSNVKLSKDIFFNFQTQSIIKNSESYILNKKESLLINLFIQNPNRIVSYEEIEYHIWNNEGTNAALKSLIRDLRKKTSKDFIINLSGIGYRLNIEA